jgi:hypothetical protein
MSVDSSTFKSKALWLAHQVQSDYKITQLKGCYAGWIVGGMVTLDSCSNRLFYQVASISKEEGAVRDVLT